MDVRALQHFRSIVQHRNLRRAAAELGVTQPALSQSIRRLEAELNVRLLERGRFGTAPTAMGEVLAAHAALILSDFERARAEIASLRGARAGEIVMGTGPSEASRLLPMALARLTASRPNLTINVTHGLNEQLMPAVRRGDIEFALSSIPRSRASDGLQHDVIWHDSAAVVVRVGHPLLRKRRLRLADLLDYPWIHGRREEFERRAADELLLGAGLSPPAVSIQTTSATLIKAMVAETDYITFVPRQTIYYEEKAGILAALSIGSRFWNRTVGVTYRQNTRLSPATLALIAELKLVGEMLARENDSAPATRRSAIGSIPPLRARKGRALRSG